MREDKLSFKIKFLTFTLIFLVFFSFPFVSAQSIWGSSTGTTTWSVSVADDLRACGEDEVDKYTETVSIRIENGVSARATVHKQSTQGMLSGNTLSIGRVGPFRDEGGYTTIPGAKIIFTADCSSFTSTYDWDYEGDFEDESGEKYRCSGSTTINGRRTDAGKGQCSIGSTTTTVSTSEETPKTALSAQEQLFKKEAEEKISSLFESILKSDIAAKRICRGNPSINVCNPAFCSKNARCLEQVNTNLKLAESWGLIDEEYKSAVNEFNEAYKVLMELNAKQNVKESTLKISEFKSISLKSEGATFEKVATQLGISNKPALLIPQEKIAAAEAAEKAIPQEEAEAILAKKRAFRPLFGRAEGEKPAFEAPVVSGNGYYNAQFFEEAPEEFSIQKLSDNKVYIVSGGGEQAVFEGIGVHTGTYSIMPMIDASTFKRTVTTGKPQEGFSAEVIGGNTDWGRVEVKTVADLETGKEVLVPQVYVKEDAEPGEKEVKLEIKQNGQKIAEIPVIVDVQEQPAPEKISLLWPLIAVILVVAAAGAAYYFLVMKKVKKKR